MPLAIFAIVLAVAGAIMYKSAQSANSTWFVQRPDSLFQNSMETGFSDNVETTRGLIKSEAEGVITHLTSAPWFFNKRMR